MNLPSPTPNNDGGNASSKNTIIESLRQGLEATRLSPELKAQILAEGPSEEEMAQLYQELQANGGLSAEEFFESLGLSVQQQP